MMSLRKFLCIGAPLLFVGPLLETALEAQQPGAASNATRAMSQRPQPIQLAGKAAPYNLANLNREQCRALPPTGLVIYNGQTISKANYLAQKIKEWAAYEKDAKTSRKAAADPQSLQLEFDRKQATELAARNARVKVELEKSQQAASHVKESPQYATLTKEANDLRTRYQSASAADKEKIKQRAAEVYKQLVRMEDGSQPLAGYVPHNGFRLAKEVDQSSPPLAAAGGGKKANTNGGANPGSSGFSEVTGASQNNDGNVI